MNRIRSAVLAAAVALLPATQAFAQQAEADTAFKPSFSIAAASDYRWRGVSQTDDDPALFLAASATVGNFYFGVGAENVDFAGIDTEYDLWGGYNIAVGGANLDLGLVRYGYIDAPTNIDTLEAKVALSKAFSKGSLGGAAYWTPDYFGSDESAIYYEINGSVVANDELSFSGAVGRQQVSGSGTDYSTWNLGASYTFTPHVSADLRYYDNNLGLPGKIYDSVVVGTVKLSF